MTSSMRFQSTPSAWRETNTIHAAATTGGYFNPLPPHGGRQRVRLLRILISYFNPLPPHGGRRKSETRFWKNLYFNPLPPHGGRLRPWCYQRHGQPFQSTPSAWRETDGNVLKQEAKAYFNPLPPHGGRRAETLPVLWWKSYFNPLPPHGGRLCIYYSTFVTHVISIHSLRMEGDPTLSVALLLHSVFQSPPSAWRETGAKLHRKAFFISPILVQSCKKGCKRLHSAPEKMVFFEKREKNLVRNLQHLSVRL